MRISDVILLRNLGNYISAGDILGLIQLLFADGIELDRVGG